MRLALVADWKPTGGLWGGAEGHQVSPAQLLINVPSHLWALGAESLQFVMIPGDVTRGAGWSLPAENRDGEGAAPGARFPGVIWEGQSHGCL